MKVSPTIKLYAFEVACRSFMSIEDPVPRRPLRYFPDRSDLYPSRFPRDEVLQGEEGDGCDQEGTPTDCEEEERGVGAEKSYAFTRSSLPFAC